MFSHFSKFIFILAISIILGGQTSAQEQAYTKSEILAFFSGFDPESKTKINHDPLSDYLYETVLPGGRSKGFLGNEKPRSYRASHIKIAESLGPSRFENSRVFFFAFNEDFVVFFKAYQEGLERISTQRSISSFNRNVQLAYWLNLYNVLVLNKMIEIYPEHNLEDVMGFEGGAFRNEKATTIEGVPLSLSDIEAILFNNYDSPLVAFGLWQGFIGGPRLYNFAYTHANVWRNLEKNAIEFVNSNRGMRPPRGSTLKVSEFYQYMLPAFGTSLNDVLVFIKKYADSNFVSGLSDVTEVDPKINDWVNSDLLAGNLHGGQYLQFGGLQASHGGARVSSQKAASYMEFRPQYIYNFILDRTPVGPLNILPENALFYIQGIRENNELPNAFVYSEECTPGEECSPNQDDPDGA